MFAKCLNLWKCSLALMSGMSIKMAEIPMGIFEKTKTTVSKTRIIITDFSLAALLMDNLLLVILALTIPLNPPASRDATSSDVLFLWGMMSDFFSADFESMK